MYRGERGAANGIRKLQIKTGDEGRTSLKLVTRDSSTPIPTPVAGDRFFAQEPSVLIQLRSETACWTSGFVLADVRENSGTKFSAKVSD